MEKSSLSKEEKERIKGKGVTVSEEEYTKLILQAEDNYKEDSKDDSKR